MKVFFLIIFFLSCNSPPEMDEKTVLRYLLEKRWQVNGIEVSGNKVKEDKNLDCPFPGHPYDLEFIQENKDNFMIYKGNKKCPRVEGHDHAAIFKLKLENHKFYLDIYRTVDQVDPLWDFEGRIEIGKISEKELILKMLKNKEEKIGTEKNWRIKKIHLENQYDYVLYLEKFP